MFLSVSSGKRNSKPNQLIKMLEDVRYRELHPPNPANHHGQTGGINI